LKVGVLVLFLGLRLGDDSSRALHPRLSPGGPSARKMSKLLRTGPSPRRSGFGHAGGTGPRSGGGGL